MRLHHNEILFHIWNNQSNVEFGCKLRIALRATKTTENLDRGDRSEDLPDVNWLLASNQVLYKGNPNINPYLVAVLFGGGAYWSMQLI
jgi:hypothetical protein